jgi:hypothetical protein
MSVREGASRRRSGSAALVVALAALVVALAVAAPALAATAKVASGDTNLTIPKAQVTSLTAKNVALLNISPVSFRFQWNSGVSWWFQTPMAAGGTFDYATKKGVLYHNGGLRFVNVATNKTLRMGGLRFIANGPKSFTFSAAVGDAPATRANVFIATNAPKFTRQGKAIKIDGVQFKLTDAGALAIKNALGVELSTATLFSDTDVQFKTK